MSDSATELNAVLQLLRTEREAEFQLHQQYIKSHSLEKRVKDGYAWSPVEIKETGYGLGDYPYIELERTRERDKPHLFSGGAVVSVFSSFMNDGDEEASGAVHYVSGNRMKIILFGDELPHWLGSGKTGVNLRFDEKSFREMENAMQFVIKSRANRTAQLREILLGFEKASFGNEVQPEEVTSIRHTLNDSQKEAVYSILQAEDAALVHGPPGTGKTTTLVEAIRLLALRGEKILVTAPSNAAADLLTERIAASGVNVVRIGNLSRIDENILTHTLDWLIKDHPDMKTVKELKRQADQFRSMAGKYKRVYGKAEREQRGLLLKEAKSIVQDAMRIENQLVSEIIRNASVVTATLVGSVSSYLENTEFDTVVIDEAAQALEPASWIPIMRGHKVVLAGDPYQLPPTLKSKEAQRNGLEVTLMEKCIHRLERVSLLRTQYRMNEMIMQFSNEWFYGGRLSADESVAQWKLDNSMPAAQPVEFIDTAGCGFEEEREEDSTSLINKGETDILFSHLAKLSASLPDSAAYSLGIISPYKAQVEFLRSELSRRIRAGEFRPFPSAENDSVKKSSGGKESFRIRGFEEIQVNTVDSFQGQERDVIYLSLVRSNDRSEIGFLADFRRMNVAMTRARKKLVITGDSATIGNVPFYDTFLRFAEKSGGYGSAWEYLGD